MTRSGPRPPAAGCRTAADRRSQPRLPAGQDSRGPRRTDADPAHGDRQAIPAEFAIEVSRTNARGDATISRAGPAKAGSLSNGLRQAPSDNRGYAQPPSWTFHL